MQEPTAEFVTVGTEAKNVGLGWMILPGGVLFHGGGGPGVQSSLYAHPASGRAAALLTNCDKGSRLVSEFLDPIVRTWTGLPAAAASRRIEVGDPGPYVGTYENNADRYVISADIAGLALRTYDKLNTYDNSNQERPVTLLFPVGNDTFENASRAVRFVRPDGTGKFRFLASWDRLLARTA